jgi:hypothetical protein
MSFLASWSLMLVGGLNWIPSVLIEDEMSNKNIREENMVMVY